MRALQGSAPKPCPFCGKRIQVTEDPYGVAHDLPWCQDFENADDALDFLKKCTAKALRNLS